MIAYSDIITFSHNSIMFFAVSMLKASLALFSALLLLRKVVDAQDAPARPPIGQSYYLPTTDILGEELIGGPTVLTIATNCLVCGKSEIVDDDSTFFKDTGVFYSSITEDYSLGAQLKRDFTLGFTLDQTTRGISEKNRTIKGSTLDVLSKAGHCVVKSECIYNDDYQSLSPDFLSAFEALPRDIFNTVIEGYYFTDYEHFLNQFGSHIVIGVTYGSRMYQHCFSTSEQTYDERDYTVRACVAFSGGNDVTEANISTCAGITQEEVDASSSLEVSTRLVIRGGTKETRAQLYAERTSELIAQFLSEASMDEPIEYSFTPVWTILGQKYIGTEHYAKVRHLEGYYLGLKNFDCPTYFSKTDPNWIMQGFGATDPTSEDVPTYMCYLPADGCHGPHDCHYGPGVYCRCVGDTCFKDETRTLNTGEQRKYVVTNEYYWNKWDGCKKTIFSCYCKNPNIEDWRPIWLQDQDRADGGEMLRHLHYKLQSARSARSGSSPPKSKSSKEEL